MPEAGCHQDWPTDVAAGTDYDIRPEIPDDLHRLGYTEHGFTGPDQISRRQMTLKSLDINRRKR